MSDDTTIDGPERTQFKAFVEADSIIVPRPAFASAAEAEAWIEDNVDTGDLGPVQVRAVEPDDGGTS